MYLGLAGMGNIGYMRAGVSMTDIETHRGCICSDELLSEGVCFS